MTEFKKGQTVYLKRENTKLSNPPHTGRVHSVGDNHVVLRTGGGTGYYKARKDNLTHNSKESWLLSKKNTTESTSVDKLGEDAPANAVGGGNVAGMGVDKPGKPGSGEPGVYKKKKKDLVLAPTMKRKTFTDFMRGK